MPQITQFTTPYEVEEDLTYREIMARRREDNRELVDRLARFETGIDHTLEDIDHIRAFGVTEPATIAKRLGMTHAAYEKRIARLAPRALNPRDRACANVLDRLIAAGQPFTIEALPLGSTPRSAGQLIQAARKAGRIESTGSTGGKNDVQVWQPTVAPVVA